MSASSMSYTNNHKHKKPHVNDEDLHHETIIDIPSGKLHCGSISPAKIKLISLFLNKTKPTSGVKHVIYKGECDRCKEVTNVEMSYDWIKHCEHFLCYNCKQKLKELLEHHD